MVALELVYSEYCALPVVAIQVAQAQLASLDKCNHLSDLHTVQMLVWLTSVLRILAAEQL